MTKDNLKIEYLPIEKLSHYILNKFDLRPDAIIELLGLYGLNYEKLSEGCHFYER